MPSTTTTTVTIGTILDLIGPSASSTTNDGQSGFDSLLQATQVPASTPSTPSADESCPRPNSDSHRADRDPEPAGNVPAANNQTDNSAGQDHTSSQSAPTTNSAPATSRSDKSSRDHEQSEQNSDKSKDELATEQIIAQSLAGLPTAPKNGPPPTTTTTDPSANDSQAAGDAKANNTQVANLATQMKGANPQPRVEESQLQASGETDEQTPKTAATPLKVVMAVTGDSKGHEAVVKPQAGDKVEAVTKDGQDQASDESQPVSDITLTTDGKSGTDSAPAKHIESPADASQPTLDTSATAIPSPGGASSTGTIATPLVAPSANNLPVADQPGPSQANNSNAAAAIGGAQPRGRLPAQSLAPAANVAMRHAPVDIDAARVISRVVRAFSAAQERDGEVHLRLSPPELGSLRLDVRVENGVLTAHLQTETDSARVAIIDNLPALRERLAEQGVRIERFDVDLMQRQPGGMPDQPGGRQPDTPEAPLRFNQSPPSSVVQPAAASTTPAAVIGNAGGLNVIV